MPKCCPDKKEKDEAERMRKYGHAGA